jgi:hypothetical protein
MFKNPIEPRVKEQKKKNPWDFTAPCYDERNMISAGDNHGVGFNNPVGHHGNPKERVETMPFGRVKTMKDDNIPESKLDMYGQKKQY